MKSGELAPLQRLPSNTAMEMLGVYLEPDGNSNAQVEAMKAKSTQWAENIRIGHLSCGETWVALTATISR